ncbi:MAG TPA: hypothetical protein VGN57_23180 [Pirellulaceae bacterium]|jgi:hypothetical protein|nr:hypothetical protein [Pirellulaceae bacterium]
MRRSSASLDDGSLELLLDTICNTFGGIIFIALLMLLLVQSATDATPPEVESEAPSAKTLLDLEIRRESLATELAQLREAELAELKLAKERAAAMELKAAIEVLEKSEAARNELAAAWDATVEEVNRLNIEALTRTEKIEALRERSRTLSEELVEQRSTVQSLSSQLADVAKSNTRNISTRKMSRGAGDSTRHSYHLRFGRLYGPDFLAQSPLIVFNREDFDFRVEGESTSVDAKRSAGVSIDREGRNVDELAQKLSYGNAESSIVEIHVWEDSFDRYDAVSLALDRVGARRSIILWPKDTRLSYGESNREDFVEE